MKVIESIPHYNSVIIGRIKDGKFKKSLIWKVLYIPYYYEITYFSKYLKMQ